MPQEGIQSVTVPGCVDGWAKLHKRFGRVNWRELFQPAIYYAEEGFPVTEIIQDTWKSATAEAVGRRRRAAHLPAGRRASRRLGRSSATGIWPRRIS